MTAPAGSVNIGVLDLAMIATGGDKVLRDVEAIDAKAQKLGAKPTRLKLEAQGAAQATKDLKDVEAGAAKAAGALGGLGAQARKTGGDVRASLSGSQTTAGLTDAL